MSKIKEAQELLESIGIEFDSSQLYIIEQAIRVEEALGKIKPQNQTLYRGNKFSE